MRFKFSLDISLDVNQANYEWTKVVNFRIDQRNHSLQDKDIEIYSTKNEGKSVAAEKRIRTLKNKIYKYLTSIS